MFFFNFQQILHFIPTFPSSILNKQIPAEKFYRNLKQFQNMDGAEIINTVKSYARCVTDRRKSRN